MSNNYSRKIPSEDEEELQFSSTNQYTTRRLRRKKDQKVKLYFKIVCGLIILLFLIMIKKIFFNTNSEINEIDEKNNEIEKEEKKIIKEQKTKTEIELEKEIKEEDNNNKIKKEEKNIEEKPQEKIKEEFNNKKTIRIKFVDQWPNFRKHEWQCMNLIEERYNVELVENNPDYILCSLFGSSHNRYNDKIKILYIGENVIPKFDKFDYIMGYYHMTFEDRYIQTNYFSRYFLQYKEFPMTRNYSPNKKFCAYVVSNCAGSFRNSFFDKLSTYKSIDSGGSCKNNIGRSVGGDMEGKKKFFSNYKFVIAMENAKAPGYLTEKLIDAFLADTIPIYWGDPLVTNIINPNAFINVKDDSDIPRAIELIKKIDEDEELYKKYLNEPIFNDPKYYQKLKDNLCGFMFHIFDQDLKDAKRINKYRYNYFSY